LGAFGDINELLSLRGKKEKGRIEALQTRLTHIEMKHKSRGSTQGSLRCKADWQQELYELKNKTPPDVPTAHNAQQMFDKSETSSRSMFAPYKSKCKQQWIDAIKKK
jgi:hypothetical protein